MARSFIFPWNLVCKQGILKLIRQLNISVDGIISITGNFDVWSTRTTQK